MNKILDEEIDTYGSKRLVLMRIIAHRATDHSGKIEASDETPMPVYIAPENESYYYGISLETIQSCLHMLVEYGCIEIDLSPNRTLSHDKRIAQDDEQDYYLISVYRNFFDYYETMEKAEPFLNANTTIQTIETNIDDDKKAKKRRHNKVRFDKESSQLIYKDNTVPIPKGLEFEICKQVFKNRKVSVQFNDILEIIDPNKESRSVKDAAIRINKKFSTIFSVSRLLVTGDEKVSINKNYL